jgi:hypothetical protein
MGGTGADAVYWAVVDLVVLQDEAAIANKAGKQKVGRRA